MMIFATVGAVLTPENHLKLSKGLIQMNQLGRMAYPKARDINNNLVKVIYIPCSITCNVTASTDFLETH
jgi:hypothetical protein